MGPIFKRFAQPSVIIGVTAIVAIAAVAIAYVLTSQKPVENYVTPTSGPIVEEVDSTGDVKAATEVDLGFQVGGTVSYAGPKVGVRVAQGTTLGSLSSADVQAAVLQAKAALQVQEANLASLQAGARPESVNVAQTAVTNAQSGVAQSKESVIQAAQDAYEKSDDAIHNKVDQFIQNPRTPNPSLNIVISDSQTQSSILSGRIAMETLLSNWQQALASLPNDPNTIDTASLASSTRANLQTVSAYLDTVAEGLSEAVPSASYSTATVAGYESSIATARANVSGDISAINVAQTAEKSAESALASAQSQLTLAEAPATATSLQAQEAQVAVAQAAVEAAQANLGKTVITSPISGTVTVNSMEPGQIASPGAPQISLISDSQFQFETYISQADLAKVQVGQAADVELDAYQNASPLSAHVIQIDPAATVQNGVSSYKVTLQFDMNDPEIQAGETGSVKITTDSKSEVLSVPTSAIITKDGQEYVIKKTASGDQQVQIQTGISSASGMTEVTSGLSSSDQIRSFGNQ